MLRSGSLRLGLTFLVVAQHYSRFSLALGAICLLFAIAGFWTSKAWAERYSGCDRPYLTFVVSRWWRVLPIFWICNLLAYAVARVDLPSGLDLIPNLLVIGLSYADEPALVAAWPLDIMLQFALVAPFLCAALIAAPRAGVALTGTVGCLGLLALLVLNGAGEAGVQHLNLGHFLLFFLSGALLHARPALLPSARVTAVSAGLAFVGLCAAILVPDLRSALLGGPHSGGEFLIRNHLLNVVLAALALPFVLQRSVRPSGALDRAAGDLSFVIYLLHWPICVFVNQHFADLPAVQRLPYVAGGVAVTIVAGLGLLALWRALSEPARRAFVARHSRPGASGQLSAALASRAAG